jgi:hypothetical protein
MKRTSTRGRGAWCGLLGVALLAAVAAAPATAVPLVLAPAVSSDDSASGSDPDLLIATIPALPGQSIRIIRVGIGGDAEASSGPQAFQILGAGLNFTWGAGQPNPPQVPLDYTLAPTVAQGGSPSNGRGFTYSADLNQTGAAGQSIQVRWRGTSDWDGNFTWGTDSQGNVFDDSGVEVCCSARAWVLYEIVGQAVAVPTQSETALAVLVGMIALAGLCTLGRRRVVR